MIPDIGFMIAAYVITRMLQIVMKKDPRENGAVVAFAVITLLVTIVVTADLLLKGTTGVSLPELAR